MPGSRPEVIVVGLGAMGSAVCFQLGLRDVRVLGLDQFEPPHPYGSTHGDTRITRLAIGEGAEYVPLVRRSHVLWREIEAQTGTRLLTQTGGVIIAPAGSPFLATTREQAWAHAIAHENLSDAELTVRFPMFGGVEPGFEAYYEPEAGYVRPEAAVRAQLELARRCGARLEFGERVLSWTAGDGGVQVVTDAGVHDAERLILCAGPWIRELLPEGRDVFAVYRQLLHWFPLAGRYEEIREMPVFVWELSGERDGFVHLDGFYGLPPVDGPDGGVKLATESYEQTVAPDGRQQPATRAEEDEMYARYVAGRLPWLGPRPLRTVSCLYTSTRGSRFVIDRHPEHERVMIVSACSGHGFKHSAAIGEAVAELVGGGPGAGEIDLSPFTLARAARAESARGEDRPGHR